jgi:hypothetical protein
MNCVSISYTNLRQALPLRDFLRRCHKHGIKVNLFIAGAHPLHFQPDLVRQLIEAADLANQPAMFAYDIAGNHAGATITSGEGTMLNGVTGLLSNMAALKRLNEIGASSCRETKKATRRCQKMSTCSTMANGE